MKVTFHPLVKRDVLEASRYYRRISARLEREFCTELREMIDRAAESPSHFHQTDRGFRRVSLRRFPYHVLYEILPDSSG